MIGQDGLFRAETKKTLVSKRLRVAHGKNPGIISKWPISKRSAFEREILARRKSQQEIADEYGVNVNTVANHKKRTLMPAVIAAQQQDNIDQCGQARQYLNWLFEESRDSIEHLKYGKEVLNSETGLPEIDPETGHEKRQFADPKVHGTVAQLIGQGRAVVERIGEVTGEFKTQSANVPQIVRVITIPKIGEIMDVQIAGEMPPAVDVTQEEEELEEEVVL